jgi:hypothetical protein
MMADLVRPLVLEQKRRMLCCFHAVGFLFVF